MLHAPDRAPEIALLKAPLISNELAVQNDDARRSSGAGGATWATFAAMPVVVADVPYGVIVLGSAKRRATSQRSGPELRPAHRGSGRFEYRARFTTPPPGRVGIFS